MNEFLCTVLVGSVAIIAASLISVAFDLSAMRKKLQE
jgi:hypothetical protein